MYWSTQCLTLPPTVVKFVTCPSLPACTLEKKRIAIITGLPAYTFTKLGNNLTNKDEDNYTNCKLKLDIKYIFLSASMPSGLSNRLRTSGAQLDHDKYLLVFDLEQNLVGVSAVMPVVFYRRLGIHVTCHRAITWNYDLIHKTGST